MTESVKAESVRTEKAERVLGSLRAAMSRASNSEGIPMLLALVDERGTMPMVTDSETLSQGEVLAGRVQDARDTLAPHMPDRDNGGVIRALVIAVHELTDLGALEVLQESSG